MASKRCLLRASLVFALILVTLLLPLVVIAEAENAATGQAASPFSSSFLESSEMQSMVSSLLSSHAIRKRAIDSVVDFLTNSEQSREHSGSRAFGLALAESFVPALANITVIGAFKVALVILATFFAIVSFFPALLGLVGMSLVPFSFRSITNSVMDLKNLNYEVVARSISSFPDKSLEALDIKDTECKSRAICEMGSYMRSTFPTVASWVGMVGDKFSFGDKYIQAMVRGARNLECSISYSDCSASPFKKWTDMASIFRRR